MFGCLDFILNCNQNIFTRTFACWPHQVTLLRLMNEITGTRVAFFSLIQTVAKSGVTGKNC